MFFNIGGGEILVIAMVALIAVGPEQLPSVLRKAGRALAQARSMTTGLRDEFMSGIDEVADLAKPEAWMGTGTTDDPVVPEGYAERQKAAEKAAKEESDPGSSTADDRSDEESSNGDSSSGDSSNGDSSNGDGPVVNQIAKANARSAEDVERPKPSIGGISTAAPRPAENPTTSVDDNNDDLSDDIVDDAAEAADADVADSTVVERADSTDNTDSTEADAESDGDV